MSDKPISILDIITAIRIQLEVLEDAIKTQAELARLREENKNLKQCMKQEIKESEDG